jgi:hypothetical protein
VQGNYLPCGHYIAEEAPELLLRYVESFLISDAHAIQQM